MTDSVVEDAGEVEVEVEVELSGEAGRAPAPAEFRAWVAAALRAGGPRARSEVSLRLVDAGEMQHLNRRWRGKDRPTNVLAFPADLPAYLPEGPDLSLLGDVVLCRDVIEREAVEQGKPVQAHWAHLTVHGTLHLLGYDHETGEQAEVMESMERRVLAGLGIADPYAETRAEVPTAAPSGPGT